MKLGQFTTMKSGELHGTLKAYGIPETPIALIPQTSKEGAPYYDVIGDAAEAPFDGGVAFPKKKGNLEYISVVLDSPLFPAPIYAALFPDKEHHFIYNLVWDRDRQPKSSPDAKPDNAEKPSNNRKFMGMNVRL